MFEREVLIDGKGHLMGRLASIVAKEILNGQRVVVVRAEQMVLSGSLYRRRCEFLEFKNKISNINPRKGGPYHFRAPSKIFWRAVRGMVPHKTKKGTAAMNRLKIFEGCPHPFSNKKKMVAARALKVVRLKHGRKSCVLGDLSKSVGWNQSEVVAKLEEKRLLKAQEYYNAKSSLKKAIDISLKSNKEVQTLKKQLESFGF